MGINIEIAFYRKDTEQAPYNSSHTARTIVFGAISGSQRVEATEFGNTSLSDQTHRNSHIGCIHAHGEAKAFYKDRNQFMSSL